MYRTRSSFGFAQLVIAFGVLLSLVACGSSSKPDPTPTATTSPEPTVGELADRIAAAWSSVTSFRTVSRNMDSLGTPAGGSPPGQAQIEVVTEVVLPDRKHQYSVSNGEVTSEYVVIGNDVFVRRATTESLSSGAEDWIAVDPSTLDPESLDAMQIANITAPVQPPYSGLSQDERGRIAKPSGVITINGQDCQTYHIVDTTQTGERVDVTLAMSAADLPCSIQTEVSGVDYLTTFEFNIPLTITPPIINIRPFR